MQWETSLYRVTVQPRLDLDLNQIGVIQQNVRMNDEATAGAIWMATNLFGTERESHLRLEAWTGFPPSITQFHGETIQVTENLQSVHPSNFSAFLRQWVPFILEREEYSVTLTTKKCKIDSCPFGAEGSEEEEVEGKELLGPTRETWSDYLHKLEVALGHIINSSYMTYSCRMINRERGWSSIYQFITRSFVEGAATCLSWFGLPLDYYLDNIHLANIPLRREDIGSQS